jgi:hypothetical protein
MTESAKSRSSLATSLLSILLLGASAIHLLQAPEHFEEDPLYGWFFVGSAAAQAAAAFLVLLWRRRALYRLVALGSAGILLLWAFTRIWGIPLGAESGSVEPVGVPDLTAGAFELVTVMVCLVLLRASPNGRGNTEGAIGMSPRRARGVVLGIAAVAAGGVAYSQFADREACSHFDARYGPLAAVDGHSVLPRQTPPSRIGVGEKKTVLAGYLVNCGGDAVAVARTEVLSSAGEGAQVEGLSVYPKHHREVGRSAHHASNSAAIEVPPTNEEPELAVFAHLHGIRQGPFFINGLRITYGYRGQLRSQVFATNLAVHVGVMD